METNITLWLNIELDFFYKKFKSFIVFYFLKVSLSSIS